MRDAARLREILSLQPSDDGERLDNGASVSGDMPENEDTRRYMDKMSQVRSLRDSLNVLVQELDSKRQTFALLHGAHILRVHDVKAAVEVRRIVEQLQNGKTNPL